MRTPTQGEEPTPEGATHEVVLKVTVEMEEMEGTPFQSAEIAQEQMTEAAKAVGVNGEVEVLDYGLVEPVTLDQAMSTAASVIAAVMDGDTKFLAEYEISYLRRVAKALEAGK